MCAELASEQFDDCIRDDFTELGKPAIGTRKTFGE